MNRRAWWIAASMMVLLSLPGRLVALPGNAEEGNAGKPAEDSLKALLKDGEDCIALNRIDRSEVIDDQTILFHVNGGKIYANRLPNRCPGLHRNKAIMYKTSLSQLCKVDVITVLENMGFGFQRGASCGLGTFVPISEETADLLRQH
jgi:hypothetical protein